MLLLQVVLSNWKRVVRCTVIEYLLIIPTCLFHLLDYLDPCSLLIYLLDYLDHCSLFIYLLEYLDHSSLSIPSIRLSWSLFFVCLSIRLSWSFLLVYSIYYSILIIVLCLFPLLEYWSRKVWLEQPPYCLPILRFHYVCHQYPSSLWVPLLSAYKEPYYFR